eukprot:m.94867 g.94867  ORF g.94867 m.94867 type:complete len:458 (+) comp8726_c0_seq6:188-1561(+)
MAHRAPHRLSSALARGPAYLQMRLLVSVSSARSKPAASATAGVDDDGISSPRPPPLPVRLHGQAQEIRQVLNDSMHLALPDPRMTAVNSLIKRLLVAPDDAALKRSLAPEVDALDIDSIIHSSSSPLRARGRVLAALMGIHDFVERRGNYGIRILAVDGGGTKGLATIEMLKYIQERCDRPIHECFDLIAGTSTGAIIAYAIGFHHWPLRRVEKLYHTLSQEIFGMNTVAGGRRMLTGKSFYDTSVLEEIFKEHFGSRPLIETNSAEMVPKIVINSTLANRTPPVPYLFRNYCLGPDVKSSYPGTCNANVWQTLRATTAAPGYFEDMVYGSIVHHDGSVLMNNPTSLGIHEAKRIWGPNVPIECVLSLGTGRIRGTDSERVEKVRRDPVPELHPTVTLAASKAPSGHVENKHSRCLLLGFGRCLGVVSPKASSIAPLTQPQCIAPSQTCFPRMSISG